MRLIFAALGALFVTGTACAGPQEIRYAIIEGTTIVDASDDGTDIRTPFAIASLGKTMTAVAVLRLADRGMVDLGDDAAIYLPRVVVQAYDGLSGVSLRHLLTMTSGLPDYYTDAFFEDALDDPARVQTPIAAVLHVADEARLFRPGARFDYSNTNYVMLGLVLETVTGQSYAQVMQAEVFGPAGMTDSFVFGSRSLPAEFAAGHPERTLVRRHYSGAGFGDGGVISTARDLGRFYTTLFAGDSLLPGPLRREMLRDAAGEDYGMGIVVGDGLVGHSGGDFGYASEIVMDPRTGDFALVLVADEEGDIDWAYDTMDAR